MSEKRVTTSGNKEEHTPTTSGGATESRCIRCHRTLTLPASVRRGMGRVCFGRIGAKITAAAASGAIPPIATLTLTDALLNITDCIMHVSVHEQVSYILSQAVERHYRATVEGLYGLHAILYRQVEIPHVRDGDYERLTDTIYTLHLGDAFAAVGLPEERQWLETWRTRLTTQHIKRGVWLLSSTGGKYTYGGYIGAALEMARTGAYTKNTKLKDGHHTMCRWKKLDVETQQNAEVATIEAVLDAWNKNWGETPTTKIIREHAAFFKSARVVALSRNMLSRSGEKV